MLPENLPPPHPPPPPDFNERILPVSPSLGAWYRLNPIGYQSSLFFDRSGRGRFDNPQAEYGILYVALEIEGAFIECFGRTHGAIAVSQAALRKRNLFTIESDRPLMLVDLWGASLVKIGADARLASGSYLAARHWASAIWSHPQRVDGICYRSRHDDTRLCCAIFDRAAESLREQNLGTLLDNPQPLAKTLDCYGYGLI